MKNNNKKFIIIMAVFLVIIGSIIGIYLKQSGTTFVFQKEKEAAVPTHSLKEDDVTHQSQIESNNDEETETTEEWIISKEEMKKMTKKQNVLLMGVDSDSYDHNKETIAGAYMILHIDDDEKEINLASILKDTIVRCSDQDMEPLSQVHLIGGSKDALHTVNQNYDLFNEYYATINFYRFDSLVDMVGGIEMDVQEEEIESFNSEVVSLNNEQSSEASTIEEAGTYLLNGIQAVAYTRIDSDMENHYDRSERQRDVLFQLLKKAKNLDEYLQVQVCNELMKITKSNMNTDQMTNFIQTLASYKKEIKTYPTSFYGGVIDSKWCEVPCTLNEMAEDLHHFLYDMDTYHQTKEVRTINKELLNIASEPNSGNK